MSKVKFFLGLKISKMSNYMYYFNLSQKETRIEPVLKIIEPKKKLNPNVSNHFMMYI